MPLNNCGIFLGGNIRSSHTTMSEWLPIVDQMKSSASALENAAKRIGNSYLQESAKNAVMLVKNFDQSLKRVIKAYGRDLELIGQYKSPQVLIDVKQEETTFQNHIDHALLVIQAAERATRSCMDMNGAEKLKNHAIELKSRIPDLQATRHKVFEPDIRDMYDPC